MERAILSWQFSEFRWQQLGRTPAAGRRHLTLPELLAQLQDLPGHGDANGPVQFARARVPAGPVIAFAEPKGDILTGLAEVLAEVFDRLPRHDVAAVKGNVPSTETHA